MELKDLQKNWQSFGEKDPFWAILSQPDKKSNKWDIQEFFATGVEEIDGVINHLQSVVSYKLPDNSSSRALDFGCGAGRLSQALTKYYSRVDGVDIASSMLELANQFNRYPDRVTYHLNIQDDLGDFPSDSFDLIYTCRVLQHIAPAYTSKYILEFIRLLKPGGYLVFQLPTKIKASPLPPQEPTVELEGGFKGLVKRLVPDFISKQYYQWKMKHLIEQTLKEPVMEMYGRSKEEVMDLIAGSGAVIIDVREDHSVDDWDSLLYTLKKSSN